MACRAQSRLAQYNDASDFDRMNHKYLNSQIMTGCSASGKQIYWLEKAWDSGHPDADAKLASTYRRGDQFPMLQ